MNSTIQTSRIRLFADKLSLENTRKRRDVRHDEYRDVSWRNVTRHDVKTSARTITKLIKAHKSKGKGFS